MQIELLSSDQFACAIFPGAVIDSLKVVVESSMPLRVRDPTLDLIRLEQLQSAVDWCLVAPIAR